MNLSEDQIEGALRMGLGKFTTDEECDRAVDYLVTAIHAIQKLL